MEALDMNSETLFTQKLLGAVRTVIFSIHVYYIRNCYTNEIATT